MSKGVLLILLALLSAPALAQLDTAKFRAWNQSDPLQWDDYLVNSQQKAWKHGFRVRAITSYQYIYMPKELH